MVNNKRTLTSGEKAELAFQRKLQKAGIPLVAPSTADNVPAGYFDLQKRIDGYTSLFGAPSPRLVEKWKSQGCK